MPGIVQIGIEGVLGRERQGQPLVPIQPGMLLYHALCPYWSVALVSGRHSRHSDMIEHWLAVQGMAHHAYILFAEDWDEDLVDTRLRQLQALRARGNVEMVIDADPKVVAKTLRQGATSLLFTHPSYSRPEHRPDVSAADRVRPWATITEEVELQRVLTVTDTRGVGESHES